MEIKFRRLLTLALLSGIGSFAATGAEKNKGTAPEATAVEAELPFRDLPYLDTAYIDAAPADRQDAISVGELGIDGGNKAMILKLAQEIADNKYDRFDSLLISYKGKLVFESYYLRGRINLPHPQASTTKAFTCLAIGRAIQLGYLTMADLDKPLVSFFKDLDPTRFVVGAERITLHQAMTMRSGIRISSDKMDALRENPRQLRGQGQVQTYLEQSAPIAPESKAFHYQSIDPLMVMQVLDAVVPGSAREFIENELLFKLGIDDYCWRDDISGLPRGASGASMTSRNMIKWGALVLNKGKWKGEQLIPEAFIAKATSKITQPSDDDTVTTAEITGTSYGYYWWLDDLNVDQETYLSKSAQGGGGQFIIVLEALDLVIVVTAHNKNFHYETLSLTAKRILPAFIE